MGISVKKKDILLVTEFVNGKSMQDLNEDETPLCETNKIKLIREVLKGIAYLHEVGFIHGDVKPGNVLVSSKLDIAKLCDFGLDKLRQHTSLSVARFSIGDTVLEGTLTYMSPERIFNKDGACQESDIWSLGITLLEFLTLEYAYEDNLESMEGDSDIIKFINVFKAGLSPTAINKLSSIHKYNIQLCVNYNKNERPTALQLLKFEW